jgi:hypothetical protein
MADLPALQQLCKWRTVLAGWHMGSGFVDTPGVSAMRDLMDKWLIMRAENNAIMRLLLDKGIMTPADFQKQLEEEAVHLDEDMAQMFPGFRSSQEGIVVFDVALAQETMTRLKFPE